MKGPMGDTQLALALALDGVSTPASTEVERLLGVAGILKDLPDPVIDPKFAALLEARLMAEPIEAPAPALRLVTDEAAPVVAAAREPLPVNVIALPTRRFVVRKALVAAIAAAMLVALPVLASAHSLPGDPLFKIERFRQNSAISHAHGSQKAFVTEKIARKWYGYGIQMTALGYAEHSISATFAMAGRLQARAAKVVLSVGTPSQIAELRRMIEADVNWLNQAATDMPRSPSHPLLIDAITAATGQHDLLSRALGLPVSISATAPALPRGSSRSGSSTAGSGQTSESSQTSAGPTGSSGGTTNPTDPGTTPDPQNPAPAVCHIIGEQQLGDTLAGPSRAVCTAQRATNRK